jgi:hypothetical protein
MTAGRSHLRSDGTPKVAYPTLADASRVASAGTVSGRVSYAAYRCPHCSGFHVGRPRRRPASAGDGDWIELGDRVIWHLRREDSGPLPRLPVTWPSRGHP